MKVYVILATEFSEDNYVEKIFTSKEKCREYLLKIATEDNTYKETIYLDNVDKYTTYYIEEHTVE
jgi:fructose-bisphosphate aldolase class 1